ncbi:hypothetical protein DV096_12340 [Bradymonadaceae bacterium TMQ3]|uniref:Uncharacterized protein n=1 Tax=Lujinxingia sediminis TaxID=2480984 RepID=A0ABY0CQY6_9DELT|nr:hypothetical protein [Lujinxingia sediminis]RDV37892.1 hypothetical protein DV096_12340 [Bradymonadaceae bacterium TMQ3]RVU42778.1 hypothetical protein EA187_14810 [Lujinxingia sediminis]TXC75329.1 hypothetical protein FRC91_11440 [Bradymonadales bacterium TMQ1]
MPSSPHALELLRELLPEHPGLPEMERLARVFVDVLEAQDSAYERLLLPALGLAERREFPAREMHHGERTLEFPEQAFWLFDRTRQASWLDAAMLFPFENVDDWLILYRTSEVDAATHRTLQPLLVPRLRQTLTSLPWSIVDYGGEDDGRMDHEEFVQLIGQARWMRVDHDANQGIFGVATWADQERQEIWRATIDDHFRAGLDPLSEEPPEHPLLLPRDWQLPPPDDVAGRVAAELLDDVYHNLRRYVLERHGFDTERLGTLILWRDWPDELFEFDEREDPHHLNLPLAMSEELGVEPARLDALLTRWLTLCLEKRARALPFFGDILSVSLPPTTLQLLDASGTPQRHPLGAEELFGARPR